MNEKDWYNVDVITCAAPNLREKPGNIHNPGDGDKSVSYTHLDVYKRQVYLFKRRLLWHSIV